MIEIQEIFMQIQQETFADFDNCEGCRYFVVTKDPYNTGDSPTSYDCEYNEYTDCPYVQEFIAKIKRGEY